MGRGVKKKKLRAGQHHNRKHIQIENDWKRYQREQKAKRKEDPEEVLRRLLNMHKA